MSDRCRSDKCKAPIVWARTTRGRPIPLDAEDKGGGWASPIRFADGNLRPTGDRVPIGLGVMTAMVVEVVPPGEGWFRSHFVSCPAASSFRKATP